MEEEATAVAAKNRQWSTKSDKPTSINEIMIENQELRDLCCFLDDDRQKCRRLAHEWQSFGTYTAVILRNEVQEFESKMAILTKKLQKLSQENSELRDLCLFLNQMSGMSSPNATTLPKQSPPQVEQYHAHAACVVELSKAQEDVPKYTGFTGDNDKPIQKPNKDNMEETIPTEGGAATDQTSTGEKGNQKKSDYVDCLEKRLERIELEKLELVKSLSAAHILSANTDENKDLPGSLPEEIKLSEPPNIKDFLEFIKDKGEDSKEQQSNPVDHEQIDDTNELTTDDVTKLSTLIDISKRLDAIEPNTKSSHEAKEIATLRMLITIAFKQLNEKKKKQTPSTITPSMGTIIQTEL